MSTKRKLTSGGAAARKKKKTDGGLEALLAEALKEIKKLRNEVNQMKSHSHIYHHKDKDPDNIPMYKKRDDVWVHYKVKGEKARVMAKVVHVKRRASRKRAKTKGGVTQYSYEVRISPDSVQGLWGGVYLTRSQLAAEWAWVPYMPSDLRGNFLLVDEEDLSEVDRALDFPTNVGGASARVNHVIVID